MDRGVPAAGGEVSVGEHIEWHVLGWTLHADTVVSTLIAAVIVLLAGLYLARTATSGVPSGLQLAFETVTEQVERQVESGIGIRTAPFVAPLAISLFFFILISNWLAILPHAWEEYVRPPTADVNLTFALQALIFALLTILYFGFAVGSHTEEQAAH